MICSPTKIGASATLSAIGVMLLRAPGATEARETVRFSSAPALWACAAVVPAAIGAVATSTWTGCWSARARSFTPLT
jgi:hypothetical protein